MQGVGSVGGVGPWQVFTADLPCNQLVNCDGTLGLSVMDRSAAHVTECLKALQELTAAHWSLLTIEIL